MAPAKPEWSDRKLESVIASLLTAGVVLAGLVVLAGGIFYLVRFGGGAPDHRVFHGEPTDLREIAGIARDASGLSSRGIIQLGMLILIATPIARVAFSVFVFLKERDRLYVFITLFVLALLVFSLAGGMK